MADDLTPGPVQVLVTVGMRIFVITDENGNGPLDDNTVVVSDVAIASSIWQQVGVHLVVESVRPWVAPGLLNVTGTEDATYTDHCDDTDIADPHNVMTQEKRGRSKDPSVIHLTASQIARARSYLFGRWPNLVADTVAALTA
jgi:hypothetical protein